MNKVIWWSIGLFIGIIVAFIIVFPLLTGKGGGINQSNNAGTEEEMTYEEEWDDYFDDQILTEKEKKTFLREYTEEFVDPIEQDKMLYVFYDRTVHKSEELIQIVSDYLTENNYPYTIYFMNNESSSAAAINVINELELPTTINNKNPISIVQLNNGYMVRTMTVKDLNDDLVEGE